MKFLVDAQLPRRAVAWLAAAGCDAVHTLDLPAGNRTTDQQLTLIPDIVREFQTHAFLELGLTGLVIRG